MTILWPRKLLPPQQPMFHFTPMTVSGPVASSGATDVVAGDAGFWRASFGSVVVTNRDRVMTWKALGAKLRGRLTPILVPYCGLYQPFPSNTSPSGKQPHSDGSFFSDGAGYRSTVIRASVDTALTKDAVTGTISITGASVVQPGQVFSFAERLYEIVDVTYLGGGKIRLVWQPPLREDVYAGTELNFDNPVCRMRLASDNEMQLSLDMNRRGFPTVNFVEDLVS